MACYLMALDKCYASLCEKFERCRSNFERQRRLARSSSSSSRGAPGAEHYLHVLPRRNVASCLELMKQHLTAQARALLSAGSIMLLRNDGS